MTEAVWYELRDIIRRKFDLRQSYRIIKLRRNELKFECNIFEVT